MSDIVNDENTIRRRLRFIIIRIVKFHDFDANICPVYNRSYATSFLDILMFEPSRW